MNILEHIGLGGLSDWPKMVLRAGYALVDDISFLKATTLFFSLVTTIPGWIIESVVITVRNAEILYKSVHFHGIS